MDLSALMSLFGGPMMGASQPNAPQAQQGQFFDPMALAQLQGDTQKLMRNQALAQTFMQNGSQYTPNSGKAGIAAGLAQIIRGKMMQGDNDEKVTDILKRTFEANSQAAQAERAQKLEDEQRKLHDDIYKAVEITKGEGAAKNAANPIEAVGGGKFILDHRTNQLSINPDFNASEIDLAKAKAALERSNRPGPADPFASIKTALAQGIITQDEAQKRMHDVSLGISANGGGNVPSGYRATPSGNLEAIPGGPSDPTTQANKPQPVSAENRVKLGLLDQAISSLDNYKSQGMDKQGNPTPFKNAFSYGNTADTSLDESIANMLRIESGAAISQGEIAAAKARYAPSALRSDEENKNRVAMLGNKLKTMRDTITQGSPEAAPAGAMGGAHKVGDVLTVHGKQYRVTGGNPSDPDLAPL